MKEYLLEEVFEKPISGEWGNEIEEGQQGVKVIRTTNFTNKGVLDLTDVVSRDIDIEKHTKKILQKGDIIIEKSGGSPNQPVGRTVLFEGTDEVCFCNNFTSVLRPKPGLNSKYLLYMLMDLYIQKRVLKYQNKTTGIINLKLNDYLSGTKVRIPTKEVQDQIANILDKAQQLIDKRKEQIQACDELIKSQFIEMFGSVKNNIHGYEVSKIQDVADVVTGSTPSRAEPTYYGGSIPWVKTGEISKQYIADAEEYITEKAIKETNCKVLPVNSIMIAMYGQGKTRGQAGLLKIQAATNQACAAILPNDNYNSLFLYRQMDLMYNELRELGRGGNQPNLNLSMVKNFEILLPPIELQNKFAEFVQHIDKLKLEMQQSLAELENNFNALMQKAFKGELF